MSKDNRPHIPNQQKTNPTPLSLQQVQMQLSIGPLPSPQVLAEYAKIYPGLEKIIVQMAQEQSKHRMEIEKIFIPSREKQSNKGQNFAFIITCLLIILAGFALYYKYPAVAIVVAGSTIIPVITLFIGKNKQIKEQTKNK
jgi:uncharacterized membrane protein